MKLCSKLKSIRKLKGLTIAKMADLMNVSQPTVTRWENGSIDIPSSVLIKYITALGISLSDFFAEEDPDLSPELRQLLEEAKELSPCQLEAIINTIKAMKE